MRSDISLQMAVLPGIDPNDLGKSMAAFQFITTFATLIPLVDSSKAHEVELGRFPFPITISDLKEFSHPYLSIQHHSDLTEEERTICAQTAEIEDFVVQFLDRSFSLIESSTFQQTREVVSAWTNHNADSSHESLFGLIRGGGNIVVMLGAEIL